jgi:hypothetical protein
VNYALNWALASKGVSPQGDAYRNLKEKELKKHNAAIPGWLWDFTTLPVCYFAF